MPIPIMCPNCKGTLEANEELLGSQARCPFCSQVVTVERAPAVEPPPVETKLGSEPTVVDAPAPEWERPRKRARDKDPDEVSPPRKRSADPDWHEKVGERNGLKIASDADTSDKPFVASVDKKKKDEPVGVVLAGSRRQRHNPFVVMFQSIIQGGNPTDASVVLTGLTAMGVTFLIFFLVVCRLGDRNYVRLLLMERSWVQYATVFFTIWSTIVLMVKFWKIAHQRATLNYQLLPADRSIRITPQNVGGVVKHIKQFPVNARKNFLINRLLMGLENFRARKNVPEVGAVLNSQADTDGNRVESSYAMLKVLIWAIPIFGFLGTVIGISAAVENFTQAVEKAEELGAVKRALGMVTQGLAVAFDTTLLGLILSIFIMFPTNWVQKQEEDLLSAVDHYCDENLLPRLSTEEPAAKEAEPAALSSYVLTLQEWQKRLENLETALFEKVVDTLGDIRKEVAKNTAPTPAFPTDGSPMHDWNSPVGS